MTSKIIIILQRKTDAIVEKNLSATRYFKIMNYTLNIYDDVKTQEKMEVEGRRRFNQF